MNELPAKPSALKNPRTIIIVLSVTLLVVICISCASLFLYASGNQRLLPTYVAGTLSAIPFSTQTPYPTYTPFPIYTTTPIQSLATTTPDVLTCVLIRSALEDFRSRLTYEQYNLDGGQVDLYIKSLFGKTIAFRGSINDIVENVFIDDDACQNRLSLSGIPANETILLNKGDVISGFGKVGRFDTYQIIHVIVESYQVINP